MERPYKIGLVGARGYTGREVLKLIGAHDGLELAFASSRELAGALVRDHAVIDTDIVFEALTPEDVCSRGADLIILAMPNGAAAPFVAAIDAHVPATRLVDLSADYRFDESWAYGLPELYREAQQLDGASRIANPGCYATAAQVGIYPVCDLLNTPPSIFAVSGYSGAGTKPSPKNDTDRLKENLIPYALTGHIHEREISHHLGRPVHFTPHVHPAFSGILCTLHLAFEAPQTSDSLIAFYETAYAQAALIRVQREAPELKDGTGVPGLIIGGFDVSEDGQHGVVVVAEDNLLKGAAVQAVQNINLALGFDMLAGIEPMAPE